MHHEPDWNRWMAVNSFLPCLLKIFHYENSKYTQENQTKNDKMKNNKKKHVIYYNCYVCTRTKQNEANLNKYQYWDSRNSFSSFYSTAAGDNKLRTDKHKKKQVIF